MAGTGGFSISISAIERATQTIERVNQSIEKLQAPAEHFNRQPGTTARATSEGDVIFGGPEIENPMMEYAIP